MGFHTLFVAYSAFFSSLALARECSSIPKNISPVSFVLGNCSTRAHDEVPTANSWGIKMALGSPSQELCVRPSFFTNNTFIPTTEVCHSDQEMSFPTCTSRRGGLLNIASSGANFSNISTTDDPPRDVNWEAISSTNGDTQTGSIALRLPSDVFIPAFSIKTIQGGRNHSVGHLGLAQSSPILQHLSDERGLVKGFGFDAGSQASDPRDGHLIVGGYDPQKIGAYSKSYTLTNTHTSERVCSLPVTITELVLSRPGVDDFTLNSRGEQIEACIDPYDLLFRFPSRTLNALIEETNASDTDLSSYEFLIVEPGLTYPSSVGFNGSLKFTLNNDFVVEIPNEELVHSLHGIGRDGSRSVMPDVTEVNIYHRPALLSTAVLGRAFLSRVYLVVEYRSTGSVFRLAESAPGNFRLAPVPFEPDCTNPNPGLATGVIVAIVAIVVAVLAAVLVAILSLYVVRYRAHQAEAVAKAATARVVLAATAQVVANATARVVTDVTGRVVAAATEGITPAATDQATPAADQVVVDATVPPTSSYAT